MDPEPAHPPLLRFELHLALRLAAQGVVPSGLADLAGPAAQGPMHFDSLPTLIQYLVRLDGITPPMRGIR
jgi:hypothetical protein